MAHMEGKYYQLVVYWSYVADRCLQHLRLVTVLLKCAAHQPTVWHWKALEYVIRYFMRTVNHE